MGSGISKRKTCVYMVECSKTAKLVLYNSKGYVYVTDKGPWYVKAVKELRVGWIHETFGGRNVVERFLDT